MGGCQRRQEPRSRWVGRGAGRREVALPKPVGPVEIPTPVPTQVGFSGSFQWPLPLWVAPKSLSWMSPQLVWILLPVEVFGSCCSNTMMVRIGGGLRFPWILLERPEDVSDKEVLGDGVLRDE